MAKILIIDDDPDVLTLITVLLKKEGHQVETAARRQEAFDKLTQFAPAIILLDVMLSGADGRQICMEIKARAETKDTPVIMFSAHPGAADKIASYGADDFIGKPLKGDALMNVINKYIPQPEL
jgi:DNA-binding response OmpR family regulator